MLTDCTKHGLIYKFMETSEARKMAIRCSQHGKRRT